MIWGGDVATLGFIIYMPFHAALTIQGIKEFFKEDFGFRIAALYIYVFGSKFGVFCMSWSFSMMLVLGLIGDPQ